MPSFCKLIRLTSSIQFDKFNFVNDQNAKVQSKHVLHIVMGHVSFIKKSSYLHGLAVFKGPECIFLFCVRIFQALTCTLIMTYTFFNHFLLSQPVFFLSGFIDYYILNIN